MQNTLLQQIKRIKDYFLLEKKAGIHDLKMNKPQPRTSKAPMNTPTQPKSNTQEELAKLCETVLQCEKCNLSKTRTNVIFGEGSSSAKLMFVGEAPGRDEDLQGRPFVGKAGILLTKIINAMGLTREEVYIANVLKCRPPENRDPQPDEIQACEKNLLQQIDIIQPKVICTLGKFASQTLLQSTTAISRLRGNFQDYHGIKLMPTFHPSYLLRNPSEKKQVWADMQKIMKELNSTSSQSTVHGPQ